MGKWLNIVVSNRSLHVGRDQHTLFSPDDLGGREFQKLNFLCSATGRFDSDCPFNHFTSSKLSNR